MESYNDYFVAVAAAAPVISLAVLFAIGRLFTAMRRRKSRRDARSRTAQWLPWLGALGLSAAALILASGVTAMYLALDSLARAGSMHPLSASAADHRAQTCTVLLMAAFAYASFLGFIHGIIEARGTE